MNKKIIQTVSLNQNQNKVKTEQKENNLPIHRFLEFRIV